MRIRKALVGTALSLSLWASPAFGQPFDGPHAVVQAGWERTGIRHAAAGREIPGVSEDTHAGEPVPLPGIDPGSPTPGDPSIGNEGDGACCNGMGGPVEEEPVIVTGHVADPDGDRHRLAPADADLERRYAPRPAPSLNPISLHF